MKLRVLIVGADSDYAIERSYRQYMALHPEIEALEFFPAQNIFLDYYGKSLFNKLIYRLGFSGILRKINTQLLKLAGVFKPDVLLVFKGMEIFPSTLEKLKGEGVKLVNYNPDNPFIFSGRGSGNRNVAESIKLFDLYLSYDHSVCHRLREKECIQSALLPFGYDVSDDLFEKCRQVTELIKPCFIGNADIQRVRFLNGLAEAGVKLDVFGSNWNKFKLLDNIEIKGYAANEEFWKNLHRYRVQLNLMRLHNPDSHNMRSFEIPAIGGIQLAPDTPDHRAFFDSGKEIFLFSGLDECKTQVLKLLAMSTNEADQIRKNARQRCLDSGYSYRERSGELLSCLKNLFPSSSR